jgi:hypothetical protein
MVALSINAAQLAKLEKALAHIKNGVPKALSPSINRALNKGRTEIRREIRKQYLIKQKDIPIRVVGSTQSTLGGAIIIQQGMIDLAKFRITPHGFQRGRTKKPIHAQVRVGGGGTIGRAFWLPPDVYARKGAARLPIKKLLTISAAIMASQPAVGPAANKAMGDTLDKEIDRNIKRVMASAGGR